MMKLIGTIYFKIALVVTLTVFGGTTGHALHRQHPFTATRGLPVKQLRRDFT